MVRYIKVKYWDSYKPYTYTTDDDSVKEGDFVVVLRQSEATVAHVEKVDVEQPEFKCNPIVAKIVLE